MKTPIYYVIIYRENIYYARYRFIGRPPTLDEVLAAIDRRLGKSLAEGDILQANTTKTIVKQVGIPSVGQLGVTWKVMGIQLGRVKLEQEEAWTL